MSYDRTQLKQYKFFHDGGHFDQNFIENILLPGLSIQAKFAGAEIGIELPHGLNDPVEYIPIKDAALLALDWFEENQNLESSDVRNISDLIGKSSYRQISETLELILRKRVQDPQKLLKSRLAQNVAESRRIKDLAEKEASSKSRYHPATDLIAYNKLQAEITRLANLGISPTFINQLIPKHLTGIIDSLTQQRLINVIVSNPKLLRIPELYPGNRDLTKVALTNELMQIITTEYPDLRGINNFVGTDEFGEGFYGLTSNLNAQLQQNNISLDDYSDLSLRASSSLPHLLPDQAALYNQISNLSTFSSGADREKFARALMSTIVSSAGSQLSADQIINIVGKNLNLPQAQLNAIFTTLESADLLSAIELQQQEVHYDLVSRRLTSSEKSLLQKGINPFHSHFELSELLSEASSILATPNISEGDAKIKMRELYNKELRSDNPSPVELSRLRSWLNRHDTVSFLDLDLTENKYLKRLANRSRTERWIADSTSRLKSVETGFYNKWTKFEGNLPWNKATRAAFEWYDKLVEKAILRIPLPGGKRINIPIFNIVPWIFDSWDKFKRISTLKAYASLSKSWAFANPIRNTLRFTLKEYSLGGYSASGAIFHYGHKVWGKGLSWAVAKAGLPSMVKYPTTFAARFLIKIGAKGLAKFGTKIVGALVLAGSVLGSILSVGMIVGLVFDVLKMGVDFIKRMVKDIDFRKSVLKLGAAITAVVASIQAIPLLAIAGVIIASIANLFLLAFLWAGSILAGLLIYSNIVKTTINIDSGTSELIASIICDDAGNTTIPGTTSQNEPANQVAGGSNSVLARASCLAKYLNQCYGPSVNASNVAKGLSCLATYAIAPDAIEEINRSASGYVNLQCVGFVKAAVAWAGKSISSHNACGYVSDPNFVSGLSGVKPGDPIIFKSSGTCSDGAPGHIGILKEDAGANICLVDANQKCAGCVVDGNCLPKTNVAGYLKL